MRKVQARDIDAGANHVSKNTLGSRSRPEGGNDLCTPLGWRFSQAKLSKRHEMQLQERIDFEIKGR